MAVVGEILQGCSKSDCAKISGAMLHFFSGSKRWKFL